MTPLQRHLEQVRKLHPEAQSHTDGSGATLIEVPGVMIPKGWNRDRVTVLFLAPPGYPAAQPDCFWAEPGPIRLENGGTPHATNDSNPIPGFGQRGTWFSWHLQSWNPSKDSLMTFLKVIKQRFGQLK